MSKVVVPISKTQRAGRTNEEGTRRSVGHLAAREPIEQIDLDQLRGVVPETTGSRVPDRDLPLGRGPNELGP